MTPRERFTELHARERALSLFDPNPAPRELLGPFDRIQSPWLPMQGVTPQSDDGCVVMLGRIAARRTVVLALEGAFQGGSIGEVSGAKISASLDLATEANRAGIPTHAVLLLESGGVRLQEANLGLAAVAEIIASVIALRQYVPVIGLIAGPVGCFGGMSLVAALCSYLVMTRGARLGMNGPEVIEQESGVAEFDASDRALNFAINGGEQRAAQGLADLLVPDDMPLIAQAIRTLIGRGQPAIQRTLNVAAYRNLIASLDPTHQWNPIDLRVPFKSASEAAQ